MNHTGETTVTVGDTGLATEIDNLLYNDTHYPNTGGYSDGGMNPTYNPSNGDGGIWPALLLGSLGSAFNAVRMREIEIR